MSLRLSYKEYTLDFNFEAGTSRGVMTNRKTWFLLIHDSDDESIFGIGEAAPLKGLSIDYVNHFEVKLREVQSIINGMSVLKSKAAINELIINLGLEDYPSLAFGLETALRDLLSGGNRIIYENDFSKGLQGIPINGLIWMGDKDFMQKQIKEKLHAGFSCLKMKIGAISFDSEIEVLESIRKSISAKDLILRVDANGAFEEKDVFSKLERLEKYELHSIEQPVKAGQIEVMKEICKNTKVPVALDEELIGVHFYDERHTLLNKIRPQYIILKPSLVGGIQACKEWINIANSFGIGWWITSALESNVGLNAISQFAYSRNINSHQGLGTGSLYKNNIGSPLSVLDGYIQYDKTYNWDLSSIID